VAHDLDSPRILARKARHYVVCVKMKTPGEKSVLGKRKRGGGGSREEVMGISLKMKSAEQTLEENNDPAKGTLRCLGRK